MRGTTPSGHRDETRKGDGLVVRVAGGGDLYLYGVGPLLGALLHRDLAGDDLRVDLAYVSLPPPFVRFAPSETASPTRSDCP